MQDFFSAHLIQTLYGVLIALLTLAGCSEPWCVPGRSVECACIGGGKGAQTCAPSGQQYLQCICPEMIPLHATQPKQQPRVNTQKSREELEAQEKIAQPSVVSKLVNSSQNQVSVKRDHENLEPHFSSETTLELAPIQISRVSSSTQSTTQVAQIWWLIKEDTQTCELSDDINAPTHPTRLLAQGCYTKLSAHGKMRIKCDQEPMGPKTYLFAESHIRCREIIQPPSRKLPSDFQQTQNTQISAQQDQQDQQDPQDPQDHLTAIATSRIKDTWHCMCYQEIFQGETADSTACRKTRESCLDLEQKVAEGSPLLIKNSTRVPCKRVKAKEPWDLFGVRYQWLPSSQPGAWWSPRGCFLLPPSKRSSTSLKTGQSSKASFKQASEDKSKAQTKEIKSQIKAQPLPEVATQIIEEEGRCAEACRAHLTRGQKNVPSQYAWAAQFAQNVHLIIETCEARKKQKNANSYRQVCLQGGVKACTKFCERAQ